MKDKILKRELRRKKIRVIIKGTSQKPRLVVSRSAKQMYAQIIDDSKQTTILGMSTKKISAGKTKTEKSFNLGKELAKKALAKKIKKIVFDKAGYKYHGRVKALAEGARANGLKF
jgi:large subunit ribosomal protein L18